MYFLKKINQTTHHYNIIFDCQNGIINQ